MKGDIIAFEGRTLVSKLIRWATKTKVTHVGIMVSEESLMETSFFGVRLRRLKENEPKYYILRYENLTDRQKMKISKFVLDKVKTGYDFKLFFGIGLNIIFDMQTKWNNKNKYICVELILSAYESIGIKLLKNYHENHVIPEDLMDSPYLSIIEK